MTEPQGTETKREQTFSERVVERAKTRIRKVLRRFRPREEEIPAIVNEEQKPEVFREIVSESFEHKRDSKLDQLAQITRVIQRGMELDPQGKRFWDRVLLGNRVFWPTGELLTGERDVVNDGVLEYEYKVLLREKERVVIFEDNTKQGKICSEQIARYIPVISSPEKRLQFMEAVVGKVTREHLLLQPSEILHETLLRAYFDLEFAGHAVTQPITFNLRYSPADTSEKESCDRLSGLLAYASQLTTQTDFSNLVDDINRNISYYFSRKQPELLIAFVRDHFLIKREMAVDIKSNAEVLNELPQIEFTKSLPIDANSLRDQLIAIPNTRITTPPENSLSGYRVEVIDFNDVLGMTREHERGLISFFIDERERDATYQFKMAKAIYERRGIVEHLMFISRNGNVGTYFIKYNGKYYLSGSDGRHRTAIYKLLGARNVPVVIREII